MSSLSPVKSRSNPKEITEQDLLQLRKQADAGQAVAQFALACCYAHGKVVDKSLADAIKYYQLAANQGLEEAWLLLGDAQKANGSLELAQECYKKAFDYYKKLADKGSAVAQATLGTFFEKGIGTPINLQEAFHSYRQAAQQKNAQGQYLLGRCYEDGKGVEVSIENAIYYYQLAMDQDYPLAEYNLALCLLNNALDYKRAVDYLGLVIQREENIDPAIKADCCYHLGCCLEEGKGINTSGEEALHYFKQASQGGNAEASYRLAMAFQNEELGVKRSPQKAFYYYKRSTDQGHLFSGYSLAHCYEYGLGVAESLESAIYYYELAVKRGEPDAYMKVSCCQKKLSER